METLKKKPGDDMTWPELEKLYEEMKEGKHPEIVDIMMEADHNWDESRCHGDPMTSNSVEFEASVENTAREFGVGPHFGFDTQLMGKDDLPDEMWFEDWPDDAKVLVAGLYGSWEEKAFKAEVEWLMEELGLDWRDVGVSLHYEENIEGYGFCAVIDTEIFREGTFDRREKIHEWIKNELERADISFDEFLIDRNPGRYDCDKLPYQYYNTGKYNFIDLKELERTRKVFPGYLEEYVEDHKDDMCKAIVLSSECFPNFAYTLNNVCREDSGFRFSKLPEALGCEEEHSYLKQKTQRKIVRPLKPSRAAVNAILTDVLFGRNPEDLPSMTCGYEVATYQIQGKTAVTLKLDKPIPKNWDSITCKTLLEQTRFCIAPEGSFKYYEHMKENSRENEISETAAKESERIKALLEGRQREEKLRGDTLIIGEHKEDVRRGRGFKL